MSSHSDNNDVPKFADLNELSSLRNGGKIKYATDDWFAEAENLLEDSQPQFDPNAYTEFGKLMDGWETRRKRSAGHDWCIIKLGVPGIIYGVDVDTSFFTGNYAPRYSIQAAYLSEEEDAMFPSRKIISIGTAPTKEMQAKIEKFHTENWTEIVPMTKLQPGYTETAHNFKDINSNQTCTHLRLNIFPDGGIARLRVYGEGRPPITLDKYETIDLVSITNGGMCVGYSNARFGHPRNLIRTNKATGMDDGWETARRLDRPPVLQVNEEGILESPGNEWAVFRLGYIGIVSGLIVDTTYFKGNYPDTVQIDGILAKPTQQFNNRTMAHSKWNNILPRAKLQPDHVHVYQKDDLLSKGPFSHIRITIAPDGGMSRFMVIGTVHETHLD